MTRPIEALRAPAQRMFCVLSFVVTIMAGLAAPLPAQAGAQLIGFSVTSPPAPDPQPQPVSSSSSAPPVQIGGLPATTLADLPSNDPTVGTMLGTAASDGGAATYNVPIVLPPGRAGMQPALSLNYNSRNGNGVMGVGWSIGGLSSIHRCPQTVEQDGQSVNVSFSGSDRLCLDGQRLIAVNGTYGTAGTEYRTEIDSYTRVYQAKGTGLQDNLGCFRVERRDGTILHYGGVVTSTFGCTIVAANKSRVMATSTTPLSWLVEKIEDRVGNNQLYTYVTGGSGENYPYQIKYTGFTDSAGTVTIGDRVVTFAYQARTTAASGVNDVSSSYLSGSLSMQSLALQQITVAAGTATRTYTPTYSASKYSNRLLLYSLKECAGTTCHPPTTFSYNDAALNQAVNFPHTALNLQTYGLPPSTYRASPYRLTTIADLDGDGTRESAATVDDSTGQRTFHLQFTGGRSVSNVVEMTGTSFLTTQEGYADIDGDGRSELIQSPASASADQHISFGVWDLTQFPRGSAATSNPLVSVASNIPFTYGSGALIYTGDMDGDGKVDVIVVKADATCAANSKGVFVYFNANTSALAPGATASFSTPTSHLFCLNRVVTGSVFVDPVIQHIADFDGDGIPDFYLTYTGNDNSRNGAIAGVTLTRTKGTSTTSLTCGQANFLTADECAGNLAYYQTWLDVNGDGLEDFVIARPGGANHWQIRLNQGGTLRTALDTGSNAGLDTYATGSSPANRFKYLGKLPVMDVDGDGKPEIMVPSHTGGMNGFAVKMCTLQLVSMLGNSNNRHCADVQKTMSGGAPASSPAAGEGLCAAYACPEDPSGTLSMPPNYQAGDKLAYPIWWTDEAGQTVPAFDLYNTDPAHGDVSVDDNSSYYLAGLKFAQSDADTFSVSLLETPLISRLNTAGAAFTQADDLFGDGLPDVIAPIGCAKFQKQPTAGVGNGTNLNTCQVVGDNAYGPNLLPDGSLTTGFNDKAILYASVNQGVPSLGGSLVARGLSSLMLTPSAPVHTSSVGNLTSPIIPGLIFSSTNGLQDQAQWVYAPLSIQAPAQGGITFYSLPNANVNGSDYSDSRHYFFQSSMPAVSGMTQSTGTGTNFGFRSAVYGYAQAMYNHFGRGFQGFRQITTESGDDGNNHRLLRMVTTYKQKFPLAGHVESVVTSVPNASGSTNVVTRGETDIYQCATTTNGSTFTSFGNCPQDGDSSITLPSGGTASLAYQPVLSSQSIQDNDLATGNAASHESTSNSWDHYGNVTSQTTTRGDDSTGGKFLTSHVTQETNAYDQTATPLGGWWLNQLTGNTATASTTYDATNHPMPGGNSTLLQTVTTSYAWNTDRTLQSKTVQGGFQNQEVVSVYCYPQGSATKSPSCPKTTVATSYGLPTSMKICLGGGYDSTTGNCLGDVTTTQSPERTTFFTYSKDGTTAATDGGYFVLTISRDPLQLFSATTPNTTQTTTTYHEPFLGQVTTTIDPNGIQTKAQYDDFGRVIKIDHLGNDSSIVDPQIQSAYNSCIDTTKTPVTGHCASTLVGEETNPLDLVYEANAAYRITTVQDGYPTKATWYDMLGRKVRDGHMGFGGTFIANVMTYDTLGTISAQSTPYFVGDAPYLTTFTYDALNRPSTKLVDDSELVTSHTKLKTDYKYVGRQTSLTIHDTGVTLNSDTSCPSGKANLCIQMTRSTNALGQLMQATELPILSGTSPTTIATNYWMEPFGHVNYIKDADGNITSATYNAIGQRTGSSDPDQTGSWNYTYDALGELLSQTDPRGVVTTVNSRDALGRTSDVQQVPPTSVPLGLANETLLDHWTYDPTNGIGEIDTVTRRRGSNRANPSANPVVWQESYTYEAHKSRLSQIGTTISEASTQNFVSKMSYDSGNGHLLTRTYPSNLIVTYSYTTYGQLQSLSNGSTNYWTATAENEWDHVTGETFFGGILGTHVDYHSTGQASQLKWTNKDQFDYGYDTFGNLINQRRSVNAVNFEQYSYDPLQRLTKAARTNGATVNYGYANNGNLTFKDDFSTNSATAYGYAAATMHTGNCGPHAANAVQLPNGATATYACDVMGNVIGGTTITSATYDADSRPRTLSRAFLTPSATGDKIFCNGFQTSGTTCTNPPPTGGSATWAYGTNGQRSYEHANGVDRYFGPVGYEVTGSNQIHELGPVTVSTGATNNITVVLRDRLGSTLDAIDTGKPLQQRSFDAFGKARNGDMSDRQNGTFNLSDTIHGFTSHTHADEVALVHMKGRIFDPNLGRFLSVDPMIGGAGSQALNPYSYVLNSPFGGTDPSGYQCADEATVVGATCSTNDRDFRSADPFSGVKTYSVGAGGIVKTTDSTGGVVAVFQRGVSPIDGSTIYVPTNGGRGTQDSKPSSTTDGSRRGAQGIDDSERDPGKQQNAKMANVANRMIGVLRDAADPCAGDNQAKECLQTIVVTAVVGKVATAVGKKIYSLRHQAKDFIDVARKAGREDLARSIEQDLVQRDEVAYHYGNREFARSIEQNGLFKGTYATPNGTLSPLQAQLELALPPIKDLPSMVVRIDLAGLRRAGYEIPEVTRVTNLVKAKDERLYSMPGGGYEMEFPYPIPAEFVQVVR